MFDEIYPFTPQGVCELSYKQNRYAACRGKASKYVNSEHPEWLPSWRCEQHVPLATVGWTKEVV
jgi:hypothetical protein